MTIKAIIGLGNPGLQYESTRHNIGMKVIDKFADQLSLSWQEKFKGDYATGYCNGEKIFLLKPKTFMNKSGQSISALMQFFKIKPEEILVLHDDLELNFGFAGLKNGGGLAGHNGLRSTSELIGTKDFKRFRIGIGRPSRGDVSSHVLGKFTEDEQIVLPVILDKCNEILNYVCEKGYESGERKFRKINIV